MRISNYTQALYKFSNNTKEKIGFVINY